jgi:hypothetical protein
MTWITRTIKLPEECQYRYQFPGHPDDCTHKKSVGKCNQGGCPFMKAGEQG